MSAPVLKISPPTPIEPYAKGLLDDSIAQLKKDSEHRCVYVETINDFGTGFVFETGMVATCKHFLRHCRGKVWVNGHEAKIIYRSRMHDLAMLAVPTGHFPTVQIVDQILLDERVFFYANTYDLRRHEYRGKISHIEKKKFAVGCVSDKGNCGAAIQTEHGLVGISCTPEDVNVTIAVLGRILRRVIAKARIECALQSGIPNDPSPQQLELI